MLKKVVSINFEREGTKFDAESEWNAKDYDYYVLEEDIKPGDLVVVKVHHKYKIVRVSKVKSPLQEHNARNYIIQKVDVDSYQKKQEELIKKELKDHEFQRLMDIEAHLAKYQEVVETTKSSRLKEIAKEKIKELEAELA